MSMVTLALAGKAGAAPVVRARLSLPRVGAWVADLEVDTQAVLAGKVDIAIGSRVLTGTVSRARVVEGLLRARVVAGADGLRRLVKPKHYTSPTLQVVLSTVLADAGEALAGSANAGALGTQLLHWTTMQMPLGQQIRALLEHAPADTAWRHLPDGTVWVGPETWPDSTIRDFRIVGDAAEDDVYEVGLDEPWLLPGTMLGELRVDAVEMRVTGGDVRATVWTVP